MEVGPGGQGWPQPLIDTQHGLVGDVKAESAACLDSSRQAMLPKPMVSVVFLQGVRKAMPWLQSLPAEQSYHDLARRG